MKNINEVLSALKESGLDSYAYGIEKVISCAEETIGEGEKIKLDFSDDALKKINSSIKTPYIEAGRPALDDGTSIYVDISLESKENWPHNIFMNSRHSTFFIYDNGVIEQIQKSYEIKDKFRKTKAKSIDDVISKINKYVELISNSSKTITADSDEKVIEISKESESKINNGIKAPYKYVAVSDSDTLSEFYVILSLDDKNTWKSNDLENSRYVVFVIGSNGDVYINSKNKKMPTFKKVKVNSVDEAINKINKYVELINQLSIDVAIASNSATDSDEIEKGDSVRLIKDRVKKYPMTGIYLSVNTLIVRNISGETCLVGRNFKEDESISVKKKDLYIVKKGKGSKESEFFNETTADAKDTKLKIKTLKDLYQSREYDYFIDSKLGNDLFINDPDRADRIHKYSEEGLNGSTHQEIIEDWRDYLNTLKVFDPEFEDDDEDLGKYDITQETYDNISKEIDETEKWHENNGSINKIIG